MPPKTKKVLEEENEELKGTVEELRNELEKSKAEEARRKEEEEQKKKKEEEEKEEGLRLLSEREKAQKEESNIRKTLKEREKEYKARKEARRIEEQKDNEEKDRIIARQEARIAAENLETEEIYKLNEDSKQAFVKWQKAEEEFGSHSYSAKLIWDRECVVCLVVAPFTRGVLVRCGHAICYPCTKTFQQENGKDAEYRCPICRRNSKITRFYESPMNGEDLSRKIASEGDEQSSSSKVSRRDNIRAPANEANGVEDGNDDDRDIIIIDNPDPNPLPPLGPVPAV